MKIKTSNYPLKKQPENRQGQVLLITIMLLATAITIVLSSSFKSTTETQITKLEEENQKALAVAEGAIESTLRSKNYTNLPDTNYSGGASISLATTNTFTTPLLQRDEQYTFYLVPYDETTNIFGNPALVEPVNVCIKPSSSDPGLNPALEITLIKQTGIKRYAVDANSSRISNITTTWFTDSNNNWCYAILDITNDSQLIIVRELFAGGKIIFSRLHDFPPQGTTISSQAQSKTTNVTKKIQLFQSYPQIPADFFTTSV